jgi:phosphatidylglycerophosphate synthase
MSTLSILLIAAVAVVLFMGLFNMMKGGSPNKSQQFMRWRVGLQFIAVIALMLGLWLSQRGT